MAEKNDEKFPGVACMISGVMTLLILWIFKKFFPAHHPWLIVFLPIFTVVMFFISLFSRKEVVLAIIGLLIGIGSVIWFYH